MDTKITITIPANDNKVELTYPQTLNFRDIPHEIALFNVRTQNSWHNIDATLYDNADFRYFNGTDWVVGTIPDGNYTIADIESAIQQIMKDNTDSGTDTFGNDTFDINFTPNYSTQKLHIELSNSYQLDLSTSNLYYLLGFSQAIVTTSADGPNKMNVLNDVNAVYVHCDVISGNMYDNATKSDLLFEFLPDVATGGAISKDPTPLYVGINTNEVYRMNFRVTDQEGVDFFFNEIMTMTLHIRPRTILNI